MLFWNLEFLCVMDDVLVSFGYQLWRSFFGQTFISLNYKKKSV